jgi:DNA polymerase-1
MQSLDIETVGLDPEAGRVRLVQIRDGSRGRVYDGHDPRVPDALRALEQPVAHNAPFERRWIKKHYGIDLKDLHDTMVMSRVLYTGTNAAKSKQFSHRLQAVVKRELKRELDKTEQNGDWTAEVLTTEQIRYAARDAHVLPELAEALLGRIDKAGLREVYELERRVSHAVAEMERNGFAINEEKLGPLVEGVTADSERLKAELEAEWGINPGSGKQLAEYFGLAMREDWPTTKAGAPKTDQDAIKLLLDEEPSIAKWIEWKKVEKLRSTYGKSLQKQIVNGRIHARFHPFGAATGRFSSSNPNLQNIPKNERLRSLFWSGSDDRVLIKADYSGIELWLAAVLWGEKRMQRLLKEGLNLHTATAASIYNMPMEAISKDSVERHVGKTTNFALLYGAGPGQLRKELASDGVLISEQESYDIFRKFLDTYPAFNRRHSEMRIRFEEGRIKEARTRIGRRRSDTVDWYGPLLNHEIQGTGADGLKYAMARIHETNPFPSLKMVCARSTRRNRVLECDANEADEVAEWVSEQMNEDMIEAVCAHPLRGATSDELEPSLQDFPHVARRSHDTHATEESEDGHIELAEDARC